MRIASAVLLSTYAWFPSPINDLTCCESVGPAARPFWNGEITMNARYKREYAHSFLPVTDARSSSEIIFKFSLFLLNIKVPIPCQQTRTRRWSISKPNLLHKTTTDIQYFSLKRIIATNLLKITFNFLFCIRSTGFSITAFFLIALLCVCVRIRVYGYFIFFPVLYVFNLKFYPNNNILTKNVI